MPNYSIETYAEFWPDIVDTMHGGLFLVRPDGKIALVNRAMEQMTGYSRDDLIGTPCTILRCDRCEMKRSSSRSHWCELFEDSGAGVERCRCELIRKDGTLLPALKSASVLKHPDGEIVGVVETLTDLTEIQKMDEKIQELSRMVYLDEGFCGMTGRSQPMERVYSLIEKAARSDAPVIITGESGTGKELAAKAVHDLSDRRDGPFIQLNCAALNESLLESELFGHVKGAFTGAYRHRIGRFEAADGGSILLDEIGDMPLATQIKLLRVLESREIERVGDHTPLPVDVRIIVATNQDLPQKILRREFREDLYFRINVIPVHMPPLRERKEDIPLLVEALVREMKVRTGKPITGLSRQAMKLLLNYSWNGNVRELRSALEFAFAVAETGLVEPGHLPDQFLSDADSTGAAGSGGTGRSKESCDEKTALIAALKTTGGNRSKTADTLGVTRTTVWNRMRKYNIQLEKILRVTDWGDAGK